MCGNQDSGLVSLMDCLCLRYAGGASAERTSKTAEYAA